MQLARKHREFNVGGAVLSTTLLLYNPLVVGKRLERLRRAVPHVTWWNHVSKVDEVLTVDLEVAEKRYSVEYPQVWAGHLAALEETRGSVGIGGSGNGSGLSSGDFSSSGSTTV